MLIGTTLNLETIWSRSDDLVYQLEFPTYAADAWYQKKVAPDLQKKDLKSFLKEAETFAMGEYANALGQGRRPSGGGAQGDDRQTGALHRTGSPLHRREQSALGRLTLHAAAAARQHETIGRYDGRLTGPSSMNTGETSEYDPSSTLITPPFMAMFHNYIRNELSYKTDMMYYTSGGIQPWDYGVQNGFGDTTSMLRVGHGEESVHEGAGGGGLLRSGHAVLSQSSIRSTIWV